MTHKPTGCDKRNYMNYDVLKNTTRLYDDSLVSINRGGSALIGALKQSAENDPLSLESFPLQ